MVKTAGKAARTALHHPAPPISFQWVSGGWVVQCEQMPASAGLHGG